MVQTTSFTIPVEGKLLSVIASVLALRTLAFVVLAPGAVVAATYLITLALDVLISICAHLAILYDGSDSTLRLPGLKAQVSCCRSNSPYPAIGPSLRPTDVRADDVFCGGYPRFRAVCSFFVRRDSRSRLAPISRHCSDQRWNEAREVGRCACPRTRRWLVLRSHDSLFQSSSLSGGKKWKCPTTHHSKQGTLFIPHMNDGGFQAILGVRPLILCMLGYVLVNVFSSFTRSLGASCRK